MKNKLYKPSNGTEGDIFMSAFCFNCRHWEVDDKTESVGCSKMIQDMTMFYDTDDPEYPKEWRYEDGRPTCTAHQLPILFGV